MDPSQPVQRQRSPWLYVLLGCGAFAVLSCLGVFATCGFVAKKGADMQAGILDPKTRDENAVKMLGGIPDGYYPVASVSFFVVDTTVLCDSAPLPDGGFEHPVTRTFMYFRVMAMEQNKKARDFFTSDSKDTSGLRASGINIDAKDVIKRGNLTVEGRRIYYVASRGEFESGARGAQAQPQQGINTAMMFDCPGDQLRIGVWTMEDPNPKTPTSELDLTGTVADEQQLARFVKPMDPCGK